MLRTRVAMLAALMGVGAIALAACSGTAGSITGQAIDANHQPAVMLAADISTVNGSALASGAQDGTGDFSITRNDPASAQWVQLTASAAGKLNPVVINGVGRTLYRFDKDTPSPSKSNCDGACAVKWPPVEVAKGAHIYVDGVSPSDVGVIKRDDGKYQVTIHNWPVYTFSGDHAAGDTNGQGVDGTWFGVTPTGGKASSPTQTGSSGVGYETGTAASNNAPPNTGDFYNGPSDSPSARKWVQLNASSANGLNPIVTNGTGFTLYRFDKDTDHPSKSNCDGSCAVTWPPVEVVPGSHIFVNGVPTSEIGLVKRDDGHYQVTIGGAPIYRFAKDTAPGQTNGEGVGGTWFAVSPTGDKVLPPAGSASAGTTTDNSAPATGTDNAGSGSAAGSASTGNGSTDGGSTTTTTESSSVTLGNGTVTLFDSVDPANDSSQQIAGPGCQNVFRPNVAERLTLDGGPVKIWTGMNCTGTSHVVTASIPDLNTIGFGGKIESVRFGS